MTAAEMGDRMSAVEFEHRLLLEQVRAAERAAAQAKK